MRGLNPDQLKAFLEVIELGSFTAAAKKLNLSQPAVSLQIRELEAKCGLPLLDRNGRRPIPTAAGRQLVVHARRIMQESEEALAEMQRIRSSALGLVRLGMTTPTLTYLVRSAIRILRQKQPDIELVLSLAASRRLVEYVRDGEIDLAIVSLPIDPTGLNVQVVYEEEVVGIVPEANVAPCTVMTPERLSACNFYVQGNPDAQMTIALEWFRSAGLTPQAWIEVETLEACCAAAGAGLGVTIAPAGMVEKVAEPSQIFKLDPPINRRLAIISRADVDLARQACIVRDALVAHLATGLKAGSVANHSMPEPSLASGKLRPKAAVA